MGRSPRRFSVRACPPSIALGSISVDVSTRMIPRYTHPEMGAIWSEQRRYETWLAVELAATDAMVEAGLVPADAARELRARASFDVLRIEEIERTTQHDVMAFTAAVAEKVGPGE